MHIRIINFYEYSNYLEDLVLWPNMGNKLRDFLVTHGPLQLKHSLPKNNSERKKKKRRTFTAITSEAVNKLQEYFALYQLFRLLNRSIILNFITF